MPVHGHNSALEDEDDRRPSSDRLISYALAASWASALGCIMGIWIAVFFPHSRGLVATLGALGFIAGLIIGPIVRHLRGSNVRSDTLVAISAEDTAREFDEASRIAQVAGSLLPFAYATSLGATLGCVGGISVFALAHGAMGSLARFCAGGFLLGALAGLTLITIYRGVTGGRAQSAQSDHRESYA